MGTKVDDQGVEYDEICRHWLFTMNVGGMNVDSSGYVCKKDAMLAKQAVWDALDASDSIFRGSHNRQADGV